MIGPPAPPSAWTLDHVPEPILDCIILQVMFDAAESELAGEAEHSEGVGAMASVDPICRRKIFRRTKCMSDIRLPSPEELDEALKVVRKETYPFVETDGVPDKVHMQVFLTKLFRARHDLEMVTLRYAYAFDASGMATGARHPNGKNDRDKAHVCRQMGAARNRKKKGVDLIDDINFEQVVQSVGAHVKADRHAPAG